jgi:TonB family protein
METFALYLLKSVIWLTGFALVYFLFLQNERFFRLKRYYLVAGVLISIIFPLFTFHYQVDMAAAANTSPGIFPSDTEITSGIRPLSGDKKFDFSYILMIAYLSGILFFIFKSIRHARSLLKTINKMKVNGPEPAKIVRTSDFSGSFSFFNYVFINPSVDDKELDVIMNHELVHVNQKHWLDLLLGELLRMIQWINPFAWIYTGFIRQNHEYIADEVALQQTSDPSVYKAVLVNQLFDSKVFRLSNSFNYSLNKKRFDMMKKTITSPYRKMRLLLVLPVFAFVFYAFARPEYHYVTTSGSPVNTVLTSEAIQKAAGVRIKNADGSEAKPLIVVDGVINEKRDLKEINPNTIASMTVLKDKASTDKYGDKGKNGVIEITTKNITSEPQAEISRTSVINQKTVKGIVVNTEGQPIEKVAINTTGTAGNVFAAETGKDGRFELNFVQADASLMFYCRGYKPLTLKPDFSKDMSIKLEKDPEYKAPATVQRSGPLVVIDGVITDKSFLVAYKELGYNMGITKNLMAKDATAIYGEKGAGGALEITTRKKALEMGLNPPYPRLAPQDFPTFNGSDNLLFNEWVAGQIKYPVEATAKNAEGYVTVNFTIEMDGTITNFRTTSQTDPVLGDEVIRVIKTSPKWDPPKNSDIKEPYNSSVTVGFKLPDQIVKQMPFVVVEEMPMYPGGEVALLKFLYDNTKYPEAAKADTIQGKVILRFIVNTEGNTEGISVLKSVHPLLDAEAVRVVKLLSGFKPGMQGGKAVPVWYMVPVNFTLQYSKKK